jgi:hypothetical protein
MGLKMETTEKTRFIVVLHLIFTAIRVSRFILLTRDNPLIPDVVVFVIVVICG